jgi:hypothetical protein
MGKLHNSVFVIAPNGTIIGTHRKVHVVRVGEDGRRLDHRGSVVVPGVNVAHPGVQMLIRQPLRGACRNKALNSVSPRPGVHGSMDRATPGAAHS